MDLLIAAATRVHELTLFTRDDDRVPVAITS